MRLYEYMAKDMLARFGIRTPRGRLVSTPQQAADACAEMGQVVLKAQVLAGKRGRAGGILPATSAAGAATAAGGMLGKPIHGHVVERILCEQKIDVKRELYLGLGIDSAARKPVLVVSDQGGVAIEEVPERNIIRRHVDVQWGLFAFATREALRWLDLSPVATANVIDTCLRMYRVFRRYDAELVEINPLGLLPDDSVMALDARIEVDDDAAWRQRDIPLIETASGRERAARELGFAYVEMDGDIAVLGNGAGMTMATLDILQRYGGKAAGFMDLGSVATIERAGQAIEFLLASNPRVLLVNVVAGTTKCDDVAAAVIASRAKQRKGPGQPAVVPVVVRLAGTNESEATALLQSAGITNRRSTEEAAAEAVSLAGGRGI